MGCQDLILPKARSSPPPPKARGWGCRGPELGVRLRSLKHPLSQTPLSRGQAPGSLGPFRPPRTLELLGMPRLGATLTRPSSPWRPPPPPQPRSPGWEALEWAPALASLPRAPQDRNPQAWQANRFPPPPVSLLGVGQAPLGCPPASHQLPFFLSPSSVPVPLEPERGQVACSPLGGPSPRHPALSSGCLQDSEAQRPFAQGPQEASRLRASTQPSDCVVPFSDLK